MPFDPLSKQVMGCAIEIRRELGPELLEFTYEKCLAYEQGVNNAECVNQIPLLVNYRGLERRVA
jgi:GxxExxY protein